MRLLSRVQLQKNQDKSVSLLRRGFNLIEAAIVLAIVGLVVGGIWIAAASVYENMRETKGHQQLLQIVQGVRNLYAGSNTSAGLNTAAMIAARVIPADMIVDATNATTAWGGATTLSVDAGTSVNEFTVSMTGIPGAACIELATRARNLGADVGLVGITAGTGAEIVLAGLADQAAIDAAFSPAAIATDCGTATADVVWRFFIR